jgi:hypothetical protein
MPAKPSPVPPPQPASESQYPTLEGFIERASKPEVDAYFDRLKEALKGAKGPKADQAKKVISAIAQVEALLSHLLQVREKLESDRQAAKGRK